MAYHLDLPCPPPLPLGRTADRYAAARAKVRYEPLIPLGGVETNLFFAGGAGDPRNQALIAFRNGMVALIEGYEPESPQRFQWPLDIET